MNLNDFERLYWSHYFLLERQLLDTFRYVALDEINMRTYSIEFLRLILEIGSEVDVVAKQFCLTLGNKDAEKMPQYESCFAEKVPEFTKQGVLLNRNGYEILLHPWDEKSNGDDKTFLTWWKVYNKLKHNRTSKGQIKEIKQEYYKFANQENTIHLLAALYQMLIYMFYNLALGEGFCRRTPLPGSRLFRLVGGKWDSVDFFGETAFRVDSQTGQLMYENVIIQE